MDLKQKKDRLDGVDKMFEKDLKNVAAEAEKMAWSAGAGEGGFAPSQSDARAGEALPGTEDGPDSKSTPLLWEGMD
ncbi:hypothetical protein HYZ82_00350 [Candidatus Nomurabacteria bacterium]|nr:hypothetical protein [Candidatus Nomurabacteria bacterium]